MLRQLRTTEALVGTEEIGDPIWARILLDAKPNTKDLIHRRTYQRGCTSGLMDRS